MQHDALALSAALGLPFVDSDTVHITLDRTGRTTDDDRGVRVRWSLDAAYDPFMAWLAEALDPTATPAREPILYGVGAPPYTRYMTSRLADYIEAGRALAADERLEAAHQLLLSVDQDADTDQAEIDTAWSTVVDRRVTEVLDGTADLVDGRAAHVRVRAEIAALRK